MSGPGVTLLLFDNRIVYHIMFIIFLTIMTIIGYFSLICVIRQHKCDDKIQQFNHIRYLTLATIIFQYITFMGYYLEIRTLHDIMWCIWIPTWTIAIGLLSSKIATTYVDTQTLFVKQYNDNKRRLSLTQSLDDMEIHEKQDSYELESISTRRSSIKSLLIVSKREFVNHWKLKYRARFFKIVWILWFLCCIWDWIGTILGLGFKLESIQAICYAMWKVTAFIMLIGCMVILFIVKKRCNIVLNRKYNNDYKNKVTTKKLEKGLKKIKYLIIAELVLGISLILSIVYEYWVAITLVRGLYDGINIYERTTIMQMFVYFPIWTMVSVVLVVYSWIPKDMIYKSGYIMMK